jgi:excisionase family DNA binding protein
MEQNATSNNSPATLKVWEAAAIARVGTAAIRKGIATGRIPAIRFGRNILIPTRAFRAFLDSGHNDARPEVMAQ